MLFFENTVDRGVKQSAILGERDAFGIRRTIEFIEPTGVVRFFADELDLNPLDLQGLS